MSFYPHNLSGTIYTPEDFKAKGDGATDDQAALAYALNVLQSAGGGTLLLGANRNYRVSSGLVLPANTSLVGWGPSSILSSVTNAPIVSVGGEHSAISRCRILGSTSAGTLQHGLLNGTLGVANSGFSHFSADDLIINACGGHGQLCASAGSVAGLGAQ